MRWRELTEELTGRVGSTEAGFVVEHVSGMTPTAVFRSWDAPVDPATVAEARRVVDRVSSGEPLQHIVGRWGFRTLDLAVDARALIPRPETESVVGHALGALDSLGSGDRRKTGAQLALDLGVGSGAIACALVAERSGLAVIGVDRSTRALGLAEENRRSLGPLGGMIRLCAGDWYSPFGPALERRCALIVSNPPYLSEDEWAAAPLVVREWDPYGALVAGPVGTEAIEAVVDGAERYLREGGALVVEIGATQAAAVRTIAERAGVAALAVERDLAGRDRTAVMRW